MASAYLLLPSLMLMSTIAVSRETAESKSTDRALSVRVENALADNDYVDADHVRVIVRDGRVTLGGIVFSDWDLRDVLHIARDAARSHPVIDDITIEEGGRH